MSAATAILEEKKKAARRGTLVDTTRCVGCRSCQVSCKQWNGLPAEKTAISGAVPSLQQPAAVSGKTRTVVTFNEVPDADAPGGLQYVFVKRQCMHCIDPACVSACPTTAMDVQADGTVTYDYDKCMGCRYCVWACPFGAPAAEWDGRASHINKCDGCFDRQYEQAPELRNGAATTEDNQLAFADKHQQPACVSQCPVGALEFGDRDELLAKARGLIRQHPDKYVDHVYGEHEAGGTGWMYLASVPFEELGMPDVIKESFPAKSHTALAAVPPGVAAVGAVLGVTYAVSKRREKIESEKDAAKLEAVLPQKTSAYEVGEGAQAPEQHAEKHDDHGHPSFAPLKLPLWTTANKVLAAVMAGGVLSLLARFGLGLGATTNLSDTYAWGLWIVFDLVWIALAAGAFATAGLIYVLRRHDLYGLGRSALLMGLLSYSFVAVTLLADLGLPWHFWQLAFNAPKHSAMFEVSWCVSLYVTILAIEFMPVPLQWLKMDRAMALWKKLAPVWVVAAVTLFVYLMSRNLGWTALAFATFTTLAVLFRPKAGEPATPLLPAMAAVTFSTMHQSSLGSLFLLMPDKLHGLWWSPLMPVYFLISALAAGTALIILVELWMAKVYKRSVSVRQLTSLGKVTQVTLAVALGMRGVELAVQGKLGLVADGGYGLIFLAEVIVGGAAALYLLNRAVAKQSVTLLTWGAVLAAAGIVLHRASVVLLGMNLPGPMPQVVAPAAYTPSIVEWGISLGLIAATIFLFGLGARKLPVLPVDAHAGSEK